MKKIYAIAFSAVLALVLGISSQVLAQASPNSPSSDPVASPQTQPAPGAQQQGQEMPATTGDSKTFSGKIAKVSGKLCLKDSSGTTYQLDDQDKAKQFVGKDVKVTGTLDSASGMIHVSAIEPGA